jgi:outer membrane protein OmpA-like peptidoglycan-associated protein
MKPSSSLLAACLAGMAWSFAAQGCSAERLVEPLPAEPLARETAPEGPGPAEVARWNEEQLESVEVPLGGVIAASFLEIAPTPTPLVPATPVSPLALGRELVYTVDGVRFDVGTRALERPARDVLDQVAERVALGDAIFFLEIQGHADGSGPEFENERLARLRAESVRSYLVDRASIPAERTAVVSLGSTRPLADDRTAAGRALNRRVTVLILR